MREPAAGLVANARMYAVTPVVEACWRDLFAWLSHRSGVALRYKPHAAPAPLDALWARGDLGATFMCGFPFARADPQPIALAAPVPSPPRYGGLPRYCTDLVVRADSHYKTLADTFGGRIGWTVEHSQSGYNAVRRHLLNYESSSAAPLFAEWVGPLVTPRRVIEAVLAGTIDLGPLDSYVHDLLKRHEPRTAAQLRTVESTVFTPNPPLIASPETPPDAVAALISTLLAVSAEPALASIREALLLAGFARVDPRDYDSLVHPARSDDAMV